MKQLFLTIVFLSIVLTTQAQGIRAVGDNMPEVKKTAEANTPITYTGRQIQVGSGGGVSGFLTSYYLLENGKLFGRRSRDTTFTFIGQQTSANTKRVFATAEEKCKIKTAKFDYPGNTYKFVRWRKGKVVNRVAWGAVGKVVPANYPKFYDSFMAMIPLASRLK
jgi:hypothetical protein